METTELEEKIYNELKAKTLGADVKIYHRIAPTVEEKSYPIMVYSTISDVPAMMGDDKEIARRVAIRIHVIRRERNTKEEQEKFWAACRAVKEAMQSLECVRQQTTPYAEDGKVMMIYDYVRGVED